jgi:hypothetical protein
VVPLLAELGVAAEVERVNRPGAESGVVLDQFPPAGTVVREGQPVRYTLKSELKTAEVAYTLPPNWQPWDVRVDFIDEQGVRTTVFPKADTPGATGDSVPLEGGRTLNITVPYENERTVEIFLNHQRVRSYRFRGEDDPVIRDYGLPERDSRAGTEDSAVDSLQ